MQSTNPSFLIDTKFSSLVNEVGSSTVMPSMFEEWYPLPWYDWPNDPFFVDPMPPSDSHPPVSAQFSGELSHDHLANTFKSNLSVALPNAQATVQRLRRRLNERQRMENLQNDEFVMSFTTTNVECAGCRKIIQLDKRSNARYYPNFWVKRKSRCVGVARGMVSDLNSLSATS